MEFIRIRGARTHNLQNINLDLPRDQFIVITGLSGSGKSSLAFDTIYAEGQRRYVESLSTYARQFLSLMEKPDIDLIEGLSPAISIEQKASSHNPRSTVGTVTEIYDYLRLLYARIGSPRCPDHNVELQAQTVSQMVDITLALPTGSKVLLLAPVIRNRKGSHDKLLEELRHHGFVRARIDQRVTELDDVPILDKKLKHDIDVVVDRLVIREGIAQRLAESFETALSLADDLAIIACLDVVEGQPRETLFSAHYACPHCGFNYGELEPRSFSFNNPAGACKSCDGLGIRQLFDPDRVVSDPGLSLAAGAIPGWDRRNPFVFSMLNALSRHFTFDINTPFDQLSEKLQHTILFGSGKEKIDIEYPGQRQRHHAFEGVIPNLERRYRETESSSIREDIARFISNQPCTDCAGSRLSRAARHVFVNDLAIHQVTALPITRALIFLEHLNLTGKRAAIAERIIREITQRLHFLADVGLQYLTLDRSADTLSGGESQRIRLASQIGSGLVGVMYVLDEPSIGLHQRDNKRLLNTLFHLRDLGNTVIVVEHDEEAILNADHIVDIGPGAGLHGGQIVAQGQLQDIINNPDSLTGRYLSGKEQIPIPLTRHPVQPDRMLVVDGASGHNLQNISVEFPVGLFICVTGVSGSGKSTLVNHTLYPAIARLLNKSRLEVAPYNTINGIDFFDKVIDINQRPIGRTPRSNPATYTGLFTPIRELFAGTPEARTRGYKPGRFSFNVRGGRCEACRGDGLVRVEMHFLPDIFVPCDVCKSARYNRETLEITYKGKNIRDVLEMSVEQALNFFQVIPVIRRKLETLMDVGLGYIRLGQSAITLSGGEAQRIKLSRELSKRDTGRTLYILDEPTTGLHFHDIRQLLQVLHRLRDQGNTVIVIEHNLDVIKTADWIIDLGPEGGDGGGTVVACGTPEQLASCVDSFTGHYLAGLLENILARAVI